MAIGPTGRPPGFLTGVTEARGGLDELFCCITVYGLQAGDLSL